MKSHYTDSPYPQNAIVIVGAPRSGTSFLGRVLSRHPDLAYTNEPRLIWRWGNDHKSDRLQPSDASPRVVSHIRSQLLDHLKQGDGVRLLEKHPSNALRMDFVETVLPGCQFVHILRDGYEAALSIRESWNKNTTGFNYSHAGSQHSILLQRLKEISLSQIPYYASEFFARLIPDRLRPKSLIVPWGPRIPGLNALVRELDILEVSALQWRMCVEHAVEYGLRTNTDNCRIYRLEAMNERSLLHMMSYLELNPNMNVLNYFRTNYDPDRLTQRRNNCSSSELNLLHRWIRPTNQWLKTVLQ